jgi:hypothetical protein
MAQEQLDPARSIIASLGGPDAVRGITGRHLSRIYRWMYPKEAGGSGGLIPLTEARKLIDAARERGVPLTADDFLPREAPSSDGRA